AGHGRLANFTAIFDVNRLAQRGPTELEWNLDAYAARVKAFGCEPIVIDGHDLAAIDAALERARQADRPTVIVAKTVKGRGVSFLENKEGWHGKALDREQARRALAEIGDVPSRTFPTLKPDPWQPEAPGAPDARVEDVPRAARDPEGVRRGARGTRRSARRRRRARRRGEQLDARRGLQADRRRALLRDVHRRAADGRRGGRHAGPRAGPFRVDLRGVHDACLRLHPHGRDLAREHPPVWLARRRLHRGGRSVADGPRGPRDDARGPRQHGLLPVRREPDRGGGGPHGRT